MEGGVGANFFQFLLSHKGFEVRGLNENGPVDNFLGRHVIIIISNIYINSITYYTRTYSTAAFKGNLYKNRHKSQNEDFWYHLPVLQCYFTVYRGFVAGSWSVSVVVMHFCFLLCCGNSAG